MKDGNGWDMVAAILMLLAFAFLVFGVLFMASK